MFIDEIDKIIDVHSYGADASAEGAHTLFSRPVTCSNDFPKGVMTPF